MNRHERRAQKAKARDRLAKIHRSCNECSACCTALRVTELRKPVKEPCQHCQEPGCGIYATRPESCRLYRCLWLQGVFRPEDRPDKVGLIADSNVKDGLIGKAGEVLVVRETYDGALDQDPAKAFMARIPRDVTVYTIRWNGRRTLHTNNPFTGDPGVFDLMPPQEHG